VLVVAGEGYIGHTPPAILQEAVSMPAKALAALRAANAKLYGRDSCIWTKRQIAILGDDYEKYVQAVDCDEDPQKCAAEGIQGVPTWSFGSGTTSSKLPGFRFLGDLLRISKEHVAVTSSKDRESH